MTNDAPQHAPQHAPQPHPSGALGAAAAAAAEMARTCCVRLAVCGCAQHRTAAPRSAVARTPNDTAARSWTLQLELQARLSLALKLPQRTSHRRFVTEAETKKRYDGAAEPTGLVVTLMAGVVFVLLVVVTFGVRAARSHPRIRQPGRGVSGCSARPALQVAYLTLKSWLDERQEKADQAAPVSRCARARPAAPALARSARRPDLRPTARARARRRRPQDRAGQQRQRRRGRGGEGAARARQAREARLWRQLSARRHPAGAYGARARYACGGPGGRAAGEGPGGARVGGRVGSCGPSKPRPAPAARPRARHAILGRRAARVTTLCALFGGLTRAPDTPRAPTPLEMAASSEPPQSTGRRRSRRA